MKWPPNEACPCHSGLKYKRCCRPLHRGQPAESPVALMRSRYAAFACGLASYVMDTTHPEGSAFEEDRDRWERSIEEFSNGTTFAGLEILASDDRGEEGHVTFRAELRRASEDVSFTERSDFRLTNGKWLYHSGVSE